tara:strand:- start:4213 stop:4989 length:777 start_codon:yes stop_codon:yes gene_type:complete
MKAFSLILFRLVTGGYLVAWSGSKILDTEGAIAFSDQLYMGYASTPTLQHGLAALGAVLGVFVVLGFLRAFSYSVHALVLAVAVVALARITIVLPVDLASGVEAAKVLTPALALFLLALGLLVWRKDDAIALDRFIDWRKSDLAKDAAHAAALSAPVVAVAAHAEPTHGAHGHDTPAHEEHAPPHADAEPVVHEEPAAHANGPDSQVADAHESDAHESDAHGSGAHGHDGVDHGHAEAAHSHDAAHAHDEHKEPQHAH